MAQGCWKKTHFRTWTRQGCGQAILLGSWKGLCLTDVHTTFSHKYEILRMNFCNLTGNMLQHGSKKMYSIMFGYRWFWCGCQEERGLSNCRTFFYVNLGCLFCFGVGDVSMCHVSRWSWLPKYFVSHGGIAWFSCPIAFAQAFLEYTVSHQSPRMPMKEPMFQWIDQEGCPCFSSPCLCHYFFGARESV